MGDGKDLWGISEMFKYARQIYYLPDEYIQDERPNYEKSLRRFISDTYKLKENSKGKIYVLPKEEAKRVVETFMKSYFKKHEDECLVKKRFAEMDEKLNEEQTRIYDEEYLQELILERGENIEVQLLSESSPEELEKLSRLIPIWLEQLPNRENIPQEDDAELDMDSINQKIDNAINKFMIRTLFSEFYDFDEETYRKDFIERECLICPEDVEPYGKDYSYLTHKLEHPLEFYCIKKIRR